MDPLTLKVLATLVQMHGTSATVVSTNKGIDDLLSPVREQLQDKTQLAAATGDGSIFNCTLPHCKDIYTKQVKYYKYTGVAPAAKGTPPTVSPSKQPGSSSKQK
jgi:hypothetical protein